MSSQAVAWAIVHQAGGPSAKAVLMSIANYADAYGECWQDQRTLAEGAEIRERQFRTILNALIERGLLERVRRGGQGRGRLPDLLRLRMRELPAIITAKRKPETDEKPAISSNRQSLPIAVQPAKTAARATGSPAYGNRQMVAGTVESHLPTTLSKERVSPARKLLTEMRGVMSPTGNQRSKPVSCEKSLKPLIQRHGFDAVLAAARAFYSTPQARKDGGEFQPGLQVIANDGRLEALIANAPPDQRAERERAFYEHGVWNDGWGERPPSKGATA